MHLTSLNLSDFDRATVGLNKIFEDMMSTGKSTYPPHNIIELEKDKYLIELAVAGFKEDELTVSVVESKLSVKGIKTTKEDLNKYTYRGISSRSFDQTFLLGNYVKVSDVSLINGMLSITVVREVPEADKPRVLKINTNA